MNRTIYLTCSTVLTAAVVLLTWRCYGGMAGGLSVTGCAVILTGLVGAWDREHDGHNTVAQATAIHRPAPTTTEELAAALAGGGDPWDIAYVKELEL